jgi:hypothetical protein
MILLIIEYSLDSLVAAFFSVEPVKARISRSRPEVNSEMEGACDEPTI